MRSKGFFRAIPMFAVAALVLLMTTSASSAGYKVLYNFGTPSKTPSSGLVTDAAGNAYGVTSAGGISGVGTVYELSLKSGYHELYAFRKSGSGAAGGFLPQGNLVLDSKRNLYGTTVGGGTKSSLCPNGCGVVFELTPTANGQPWTETVLYSFCSQANCADGALPQAGVIFDTAGNLYGTTFIGGNQSCQAEGPGCGTVFELSPGQSGWSEAVIDDFTAVGDGFYPRGSLLLDAVGNVYGTTSGGGNGGGGTVFELSPSGNSWLESILYTFDGISGSTDGYSPQAGVIFDATGNLYGTTATGGADLYYGTVFELSPTLEGWTETILYSFAGGNDGADPESNLVIDSLGSLYGTTFEGGGPANVCGNGCGTVFKLTPKVGGQWMESLFRFRSVGAVFGLRPSAPVYLDRANNVYGTTTLGGQDNLGVVFKITQ